MRLVRACLWFLAALAAMPVAAQEYGLYLLCSGKVEAQGRSTDGHLDLALRRNSYLALVQRSNVLPVGQRMRLQISPAYYSMVFQAPVRGSAAFYDWSRGALFVWAPGLLELHEARISVDRKTAALEGEMRDGAGAMLGRMKMRCEPKKNEDMEAPKF